MKRSFNDIGRESFGFLERRTQVHFIEITICHLLFKMRAEFNSHF